MHKYNGVATNKRMDDWSIGLFQCLDMRDKSLRCCCATTCFPCSIITWTNANAYMNVDASRAAFASFFAGALSDKNRFKPVAQGFAAFEGTRVRGQLARALGIRDFYDTIFLRCCCMPCLQCQEIDTVIEYYRRKKGFENIQYGPLLTCQCCRFYNDGQLIPYPYNEIPMQIAGIPLDKLTFEKLNPSQPRMSRA